ncbi:MAG: 6-carboxytetrahydropterin synthase QueD [Bacillota bacterium]
MFELRVRSSFAAAHRLHEYPDRCRRLHGHTWEVEAVVAGPELNAAGMLVDFTLLKNELRQVVGALDHCYLNELAAFGPDRPEKNPTAENIARYIFTELKARLAGIGPAGVLTAVTVWESAKAAATYREG